VNNQQKDALWRAIATIRQKNTVTFPGDADLLEQLITEPATVAEATSPAADALERVLTMDYPLGRKGIEARRADIAVVRAALAAPHAHNDSVEAAPRGGGEALIGQLRALGYNPLWSAICHATRREGAGIAVSVRGFLDELERQLDAAPPAAQASDTGCQCNHAPCEHSQASDTAEASGRGEAVGWMLECVWEDGTSRDLYSRQPEPLAPTPGLISSRVVQVFTHNSQPMAAGTEGAPMQASDSADWATILEGLKLADQFFDGDDNHWQWDDGEAFPASKVRQAYEAARATQEPGSV
jgi:hypothetical protein